MKQYDPVLAGTDYDNSLGHFLCLSDQFDALSDEDALAEVLPQQLLRRGATSGDGSWEGRW